LSESEKFIAEISAPENSGDDEIELRETLENLLKTGKQKTEILENLFSDFTQNQETYDLEKIYFSKKGFETISRKFSQNAHDWEENLGKKVLELKKAKDKWVSFPDFIRLSDVKKSLEVFFEEKKGEEKIKNITFWKEKYEKQDSVKNTIWTQFLEIFYLEFQENLARKIKNNDKKEITVGVQ